MADKLRNEVNIELLGQTRTMRAEFDAIMAIERDLNKGIVTIVDEAAIGNIKLTDAAVIIFHGLRGFGDTRIKTVKEVGEAILEEGIDKIADKIVEFAGIVLKGVSLGKPKAPETA